MRTTAIQQKKRDAIDAVLAKISPEDLPRKAEIRDLALKGDSQEQQLAIYQLLKVLADFPA